MAFEVRSPELIYFHIAAKLNLRESLQKAVSANATHIILHGEADQATYETALAQVKIQGLQCYRQVKTSKSPLFSPNQLKIFDGIDIIIDCNTQDLGTKIINWTQIPSYRIILRPNKQMDNLRILWNLHPKHTHSLYFEFISPTAENKEFYKTKEIPRLILKIKKQFPYLCIQPPRGQDVYDSSIAPDAELEPLAQPLWQTYTDNPEIRYSVIIPAHNEKYFLLNVLRHLDLVDYSRNLFEVIVVDDGSQDGSHDYIHSFFARHECNLNLKYIYWPRPLSQNHRSQLFRAGLSRNLGVKFSSGKYLVFLDSDILVPNYFFKNLDRNFSKAQIIQFARRHLKPEKSSSSILYSNVNFSEDTYVEEASYWQKLFECNDWMGLDFFWKYTCTYGLALEKKDFLDVGRFRRTYLSYGFEDTDLGYSLFKQGKVFYLDKTQLLHLTNSKKSQSQFFYQWQRRKLLSKTAKIFYHNHLDAEIYKHFEHFLNS